VNSTRWDAILFIRKPTKGHMMAEATRFVFTFKELAELLVKKQGLHEGIWGIIVRFGLQARNTGLTAESVLPTAMVPILEIGIQRQEEMSPLAVDAAVVNPPQRPGSRPTRKKKSSPKQHVA